VGGMTFIYALVRRMNLRKLRRSDRVSERSKPSTSRERGITRNSRTTPTIIKARRETRRKGTFFYTIAKKKEPAKERIRSKGE